MIAEREAAGLDGPRIRLRPARVEDAKVTFAWYNDPEIIAPFDRFSVDTLEEFERSIRDASVDPTSLAPRFVVEIRESSMPIGFVGHYIPHPVLETVDIWYVIGDRRARGKGYATEAVELLVTHLFDTTPLPRIGATVDVENRPSIALLERLGFRREGVLRSALFHHARWHDVALYGVMRTEWTHRPLPA
jgi:[ribosomal protein S5]-alanine N-acetyltransferase